MPKTDWQSPLRGKAEDKIYKKELCESENSVYNGITVYALENDQAFIVIQIRQGRLRVDYVYEFKRIYSHILSLLLKIILCC